VKDGDDHDQEDHIIEYHRHGRDTQTQQQLFSKQKYFKATLVFAFTLKLFLQVYLIIKRAQSQ